MNIPRNIRLSLLAVALAGSSLTCQADSDIAAPEGRPAALLRVAGDGQAGPIDQPLPDSLVVRVEDAGGQPLGKVAVTWTVGGGGSVSQASVTSGSDGRAAVQRMLGEAAGRQTTTAAVSALPPVCLRPPLSVVGSRS